MTSPIRRVLGGLSITFALGASAPSRSRLGSAGRPPRPGRRCTPSATSQPFAPWGDSASYELVPGGDFETCIVEAPGWRGARSRKRALRRDRDAWLVVVVASGRLIGRSPRRPVSMRATRRSASSSPAAGVVAVSVVDDGLAIPAGVAIAPGDWQPTPVDADRVPVARSAVRRHRPGVAAADGAARRSAGR